MFEALINRLIKFPEGKRGQFQRLQILVDLVPQIFSKALRF